ncbi:hypothetical protein CLOP_g6485 [Closterium sp. NIES-67]|nr:hypothetical protein CLOP_g6485 [Closterium sp. NIES-67]
MAGTEYPPIPRSTTVTYALRVHATTTAAACIVLLLVYCSSATALKPISRPLISRPSSARRGRVSLRTVLPPAVQFLATRRAERTSAEKLLAPAERAEAATVGGTSGADSLSTALGLSGAASAASLPQTAAANTAALTAIFTAAQLPIPANKPNACAWPGL